MIRCANWLIVTLDPKTICFIIGNTYNKLEKHMWKKCGKHMFKRKPLFFKLKESRINSEYTWEVRGGNG